MCCFCSTSNLSVGNDATMVGGFAAVSLATVWKQEKSNVDSNPPPGGMYNCKHQSFYV
jgi:hypothetical protein